MYNQYFYLENISGEPNTATILSGQKATYLSYSYDGSDWIPMEYTDQPRTVTFTDKLYLKGYNLSLNDSYNYRSNRFGISCSNQYNVAGNIMSLLYEDSFVGNDVLPAYAFQSLFNGDTNLCSAQDLVLPAKTLSMYCYASMFYGCKSLTTAPELPAELGSANYAYFNMFYNCTSLTYIKAMFIELNNDNAQFTNWLKNVPCTYETRFVKNKYSYFRADQMVEPYLPQDWNIICVYDSDDYGIKTTESPELLYEQEYNYVEVAVPNSSCYGYLYVDGMLSEYVNCAQFTPSVVDETYNITAYVRRLYQDFSDPSTMQITVPAMSEAKDFYDFVSNPWGYTNQQTIGAKPMTGDNGVSGLVINQETGSTAPAFYTTGGNHIRIYTKNELSIWTLENWYVRRVDFVFKNLANLALATGQTGTYTNDTTLKTGTWTGSANEVIFVQVSSNTRISSITVTVSSSAQ
jgi:hypothetical protein